MSERYGGYEMRELEYEDRLKAVRQDRDALARRLGEATALLREISVTPFTPVSRFGLGVYLSPEFHARIAKLLGGDTDAHG